MTHHRRTAATTALLACTALLTACGGDGAGSTPEGWGTLRTSHVSVAFPRDAGFAQRPPTSFGRHVDAGARRVEDGVRTGAITVLSGYATNIQDPADAASWIAAGVELGGKRGESRDITVHGPEEVSVMRRIDFTTESTGRNHAPEAGTPVEGVILGGVDSQGEGFAVRIDTVEDSLPAADLRRIIDSVTVD
ncbi:hypothetical protein [Streptomyces sp. TR06-5]|uniref:hypothetical protein n=1 Tax=unclassified Streptomyces TaxID=2593676 RepID=UPI00399FB075